MKFKKGAERGQLVEWKIEVLHARAKEDDKKEEETTLRLWKFSVVVGGNMSGSDDDDGLGDAWMDG